jgi:hypothetical protein
VRVQGFSIAEENLPAQKSRHVRRGRVFLVLTARESMKAHPKLWSINSPRFVSEPY